MGGSTHQSAGGRPHPHKPIAIEQDARGSHPRAAQAGRAVCATCPAAKGTRCHEYHNTAAMLWQTNELSQGLRRNTVTKTATQGHTPHGGNSGRVEGVTAPPDLAEIESIAIKAGNRHTAAQPFSPLLSRHAHAFRLLLLRSGDIESNPGPATKGPQRQLTGKASALLCALSGGPTRPVLNDDRAKAALHYIANKVLPAYPPTSPTFQHAATLVWEALGPVEAGGLQSLLAGDVLHTPPDPTFAHHCKEYFPALFGEDPILHYMPTV